MSKIFGSLADRIKKTLWILGLRAFWVILFLVAIDLILGGFVMCKYVFLAENESPKISNKVIKFDGAAYQQVLDELKARGLIKEGIPPKEVPPANKPTPVPSPTPSVSSQNNSND